MYRVFGKRCLDLTIAAPAIVLLAPMMAILCLLVGLRLGSPILFRQKRPGRHGQPFTMFKFRTMTDARDERGQLLPDVQRLTRFGRFLRSSSLDELPELWNILRGDMSFVGPRPLLPQYLERYTPEQARRHEVRPGLTGWAQINGRNALDWETRFELDVWYVEHVSLWLDLKILLLTVGQVLRRSDVSAQGHATMPEFQGSAAAGLPDEGASAPRGVIVLGAGGHAKVVISTLHAAGYSVAGVYDDDPQRQGTTVLGAPVAGTIADLDLLAGVPAVIAVGDCATRQRLAERLRLNWITVVHPRACVHESVQLGVGTVVFAGAVVQPDSRIGAHAIINTCASVDHDCALEDYVHLGPGVRLAGGVRVGAATFLGAGSIVIPGVAIGSGTIVGAGTTVIADLPDNVVAVGCPARIVKPAVSMRRAS